MSNVLKEMASRCFQKTYILKVLRVNMIQSLATAQSNVHFLPASAVSLQNLKLQTDSQPNMSCIRLIHSSCHLKAGHSKWHNIKHIKAAFDREKGMKSALLSRKLQLLFDKNPETDPKLNTELANLIKWARANNLTNDVINNAIDRQTKLRDPKSITSFGGRGPSNTGIVIECFSIKPHHTKIVLQSIVKKFGFNLHATADDLFEYKGVVQVELSKEEEDSVRASPETFSLDKYVEIAINAGAEDVILENEGEKPYLEFICGPLDVPRVCRVLGEEGLTISGSERTYIPKVMVPVTQEFLEGLKKLTEKLDLNSDVIKYHFNVEPESS